MSHADSQMTDGNDSQYGLSDAQQKLSDAISTLPSPASLHDDAYNSPQYTGLDQVIAVLQGATDSIRERHQARVAREAAVIEDAAIRIGDGARVEARISALECLVETLQGHHNSQAQKIFELEGEVTSRSEELREKQDEVSAKDDQINSMAERIESLQDRLRRRSASPTNSRSNGPVPRGNSSLAQNNAASQAHLSVATAAHKLAVRQDLRRLHISLQRIMLDPQGRRVYAPCTNAMADLIIDQLASFRDRVGGAYVAHLTESHRCVACCVGNTAPFWTVTRPGRHTCRACFNARRPCIKRRGADLVLLPLPEEAPTEDDDLESEYVNRSTFGSRRMGYVWQEERTTASGL